MKVMNEKYQQALDIVNNGTGIEDEEDSATVYERALDTLQELVDMMKPLEFEELEVGMKVYDRKLEKTVTIIHIESKPEVIQVMKNLYVSSVIYSSNRFYRNIWEVE